jgi:hypothetical protein
LPTMLEAAQAADQEIETYLAEPETASPPCLEVQDGKARRFVHAPRFAITSAADAIAAATLRTYRRGYRFSGGPYAPL